MTTKTTHKTMLILIFKKVKKDNAHNPPNSYTQLHLHVSSNIALDIKMRGDWDIN